MLSTAAEAFLTEERGLDLELALRYGVESRRPAGVSDGEWIAVPFMRNDVAVNWEYRRIDRKEFRRDKGGATCFWNESAIADPGLTDEPLVITEGILDALSCIQAGFLRTVSVPNGSQSKPDAEQKPAFKYIDEVEKSLTYSNVKNIILALDDDDKGRALAEDLADTLNRVRCKRLVLAPGVKDANQNLIERGRDHLAECLRGAKPLAVFGVYTAADYPPEAFRRAEVWKTGISPKFDRHVGIMPGYFSVWTGYSSAGKSILLNQVMWSLRERCGLKVAVCSLEAEPMGAFRSQALQYRIGRPDGAEIKPAARTKDDSPWTDAEKREADEWFGEVVFIEPRRIGANMPGAEPTAEWFIECCRNAAIRHGVRFFALDPWTSLDDTRARNQTETDHIKQSLNAFQRFAEDYKIHIAIVAHPRKPQPQKNGSKPIPDGDDIAGSMHFRNKTSLGVTVHRETKVDERGCETGDKDTLIHVWKSKDHQYQGSPGDFRLKFFPRENRFREIAREF